MQIVHLFGYYYKLVIIMSWMASIAVALCRLINFYNSGIQYRAYYLIPIVAVVLLLSIFICSVTWMWWVRCNTRSTHKEIIPSGNAIDSHARVFVTNDTLLLFVLKAGACCTRSLHVIRGSWWFQKQHILSFPPRAVPYFPLHSTPSSPHQTRPLLRGISPGLQGIIRVTRDFNEV
jgi:hypothetical protein